MKNKNYYGAIIVGIIAAIWARKKSENEYLIPMIIVGIGIIFLFFVIIWRIITNIHIKKYGEEEDVKIEDVILTDNNINKYVDILSNNKLNSNSVNELFEKTRKVSLDNWANNWDAIIPFFKFGPELRKIMYTTNAIESLNNSYKRINKGRRIFPSETSLEKSLYLATEIITERWTAKYQNWGVILRELRIHYGDRIPSTITV